MPRVFADNIHLNYVEQGRGEPPLLLLHGLGGSDKPAGPYSVRLLAADWVAAMDALGVERADLLGLSLGGAVAMLRARLVLLEKGDMPAYAEAAIPQVYSEAYVRANPAAIDAYRARVAQAAPASLAAAVNACIEHDMRGDLAHITARTLVIVGGEDRLTPPRHSDYLFGASADAKLVVIEGSAHSLSQSPQALSGRGRLSVA